MIPGRATQGEGSRHPGFGPASPARDAIVPNGDGPRVCVVGSINMDVVVRCQRLPLPGQTVLGTSYKTYPGGKGANQAVAARRMGARVSMVARVGDDAHGPRLVQALAADGIDATHVSVSTETPSGLAFITVAEGGENTIVVSSGANASLSEVDVEAAGRSIDQADVILMQLEVPLATDVAAARRARAAGATVVLNAGPARHLPRDLLDNVDVLVLNRSEAATLTQQDSQTDPGRLALRASEIGPPTVILTLGAQGAIVASRGRIRRVGTIAVHAVDAVGAGDAFTGAVAVFWAEMASKMKERTADEVRHVEAVVARACIAGALSTMKQGAIASMPTRNELEQAVAKGGAE